MSSSAEQKLYLDPVKVRIWTGIAVVAAVAFLLWFIPVYNGWLRTHDARVEVEIRRILSGCREGLPRSS